MRAFTSAAKEAVGSGMTSQASPHLAFMRCGRKLVGPWQYVLISRLCTPRGMWHAKESVRVSL